MEGTQTIESEAPEGILVPSEHCLLTIVVINILLWILWLLDHPVAANVGSILVLAHFLILLGYSIITPIFGFGYLHTCYVRNVAVRDKSSAPTPVSWRFWRQLAAWLAIVLYFGFSLVDVIGGGGQFPAYLGIGEGPDTRYAHSGFEKLLRRPVPSNVTRVKYQNRNSILDEHQILYFNTTDETLIDDLIEDFKLEPGENPRSYSGRLKSGNIDYFELYGGGSSYYLSYNRDTGDTRFEWIAY